MYCFQWHYTCTKIWVEVSNFWLRFGYFLSICEACGEANAHSDHYIIALSPQPRSKSLSFPVAFKKTVWDSKVYGVEDTSTRSSGTDLHSQTARAALWEWVEGDDEQMPIILVDAKWKFRAVTHRKPFPERLSSSHTSKTAVSTAFSCEN